MEIRLSCAVALLLVGLSLTACGHSSTRFDGTPWIWSSQWRSGEEARAPADSVAPLVATAIRVSEQQTTISPAETQVDQPSPKVVLVERHPAKQRPDSKRQKRGKR